MKKLEKSDFRIAELNNKFTIERKKVEFHRRYLLFGQNLETITWRKIDSQGDFIYHINFNRISRTNEDDIEKFDTLNGARLKVKYFLGKTIYHDV